MTPPAIAFSSAGSNSFARLYHTVSLLLPDATVWLAGSNPSRGTYEHHVEIYKPAYLFNSDGSQATRPTIASAPSNISWGGSFAVSTPDAANISQAVLMRPGASTHAFDMDQRLVGMNFTAGSGTLTVTGPPNGNIAPPGYYMLFLINNKGVPSVAKFVLLNGSASNPAPTVSGISPTSGTTAGGTGVTITGTGFLAGANVTFGGTTATGVTVVSSTSITATTPAHAAGAVNVVVTNTDTKSGTLSGGYTYVVVNPAPNVTSIAPNSGTCERGYRGDDYGHRLPGGSDGFPRRNGRYRSDGGEQHLHHRDHTSSCRGCSECGGGEHGRQEWHVVRWLYLQVRLFHRPT